MSDADDQMGGEPAPNSAGDDKKPYDDARRDQQTEDKDKDVDEASKESFPASDPPANY